MYDDVVVLVEADGVDSGGVPGVFADILGLDDIGEDDVFVAASTDELGIVLTMEQALDYINPKFLKILPLSIFLQCDCGSSKTFTLHKLMEDPKRSFRRHIN